GFAVAQFGVPVQVAAPFHHLRLQPLRGLGDFGSLSVLRLLRGRGQGQAGREWEPQRRQRAGRTHRASPGGMGPMLPGLRRSGRVQSGLPRGTRAISCPASVYELALQALAWLFLAALLAGFIDAIAGGGGMVTIPAMLLAGIPPLQVLGTNKLQAVFGSGAASWSYARGGHVDLRTQWRMALAAAAGAAGGALLATAMPTDWLRAVLPLLLVAIALYFGLKRGVGELERHRRISPLLFGLAFVPAIGFYDGVFGPGTGSFLMLGFVSLAGFGILK